MYAVVELYLLDPRPEPSLVHIAGAFVHLTEHLENVPERQSSLSLLLFLGSTPIDSPWSVPHEAVRIELCGIAAEAVLAAVCLDKLSPDFEKLPDRRQTTMLSRTCPRCQISPTSRHPPTASLL